MSGYEIQITTFVDLPLTKTAEMLRNVLGMANFISTQTILENGELVGMIRMHVPAVPEGKLSGHVVLAGAGEQTVLEFDYDEPCLAEMKHMSRYAQLAISDSLNMLINDLSLPADRSSFPEAREWLEAHADGITGAYELMEARMNHGIQLAS